MKWPKRDRRTTSRKLDLINFNLLSPYTVSKMIDGTDLLNELRRTAGETSAVYSYQGLTITASALRKGIMYYGMAIDKFMGNSVIKRLEGAPLHTDDEIRRRMVFDNLGLLHAHIAAGRSVAVYFGHAGNWEWAPSVTLHMQAAGDEAARFAQVYRPLSNGAVDALMLRLRSRFGSVSLPKAIVFRSLAMWRAKDIVSVTGFMSDQKPSHGDPTVPLLFLGRPTAFISGTETLARRLGMAAIYWDMEKTSRGHYRITCRPLADNVAETAPGEITRSYAAMLEKTITRNPAIWLWTHKRWKHPVDPSSLLS